MYQAVYKCRLCGKKYKTFDALNRETAEECVDEITRKEIYYPWRSEMGIKRLNIHNCRDGSFGFADFQGLRKSEE